MNVYDFGGQLAQVSNTNASRRIDLYEKLESLERARTERGSEQIMYSQFGVKVLILNNPTANLQCFAWQLAHECV